MKFTFGFNIAKQKINWNKLTKHNLRTHKINDKNKNINPKLSKYNQFWKLNDKDKLLENNCHDYVINLNKRLIKDGHKKRCTNTKDYVKKHGKDAERTVIVSLGKERDRDKLEKSIMDKYTNAKTIPAINKIMVDRHLEHNRQFHHDANVTVKQTKEEMKFILRTKIEPRALHAYMLNFNKRHHYLHFCEVANHNDEKFIHAHARMIATPTATHTKNHRPSFSFSKAVRETGHSKDGRQALRNIQATEAPIALKFLSKYMNTDIDLERTGNATTLSGKRYKHYAKMSDMAKNEEIKASEATSKAQSASIAQSQIIHGLNSTFASASSSVQSSSASASYSLSSAVKSLNTAKEKWQSYIYKSLSDSASNSVSATVKSINSSLDVIHSNQSSSQSSLAVQSKSLSTWDSNLASSANDISSGSSSISAASLSNANYSHKLDKREQRIQRNKNAHDNLLAQNIMLAMPKYEDMTKPMQRSTVLAFDRNEKLNVNKVKKLFITGFYHNSGMYQPPYGMATGHSSVKGTAMLVYLYGYDAQHAINKANLQSIINNTKDYEKNAKYKSDSDDLQL